MINIRETTLVPYGDRSILLYRDSDVMNKYYIVPTPVFAVNEHKLPVFNLTKYISNTGVKGFCTFSVQLDPPQDDPAIREAIYQALGYNIVFGQFDWVQVTPVFMYELDGPQEIQGSATMYDNNRATFFIELPNEVAINAFAGAFHQSGGGASGFYIQYNLTALTKLKAVKATVKYHSQIAIEFAKTVHTSKDTWGNTKVDSVEIKKNLQQSKAGSVNIEWKEPPSEEFNQLVHEWAWSTLEKAVANAIEVANAAAVSDSPVNATSDFEQTFEENQVIEWAIFTQNELPSFGDAVWNSVYHEVDNQQLVVCFSLLGDFGLDNVVNVNKFERMEITIDYPTRQTDNTIVLGPGNGNITAEYIAKGDIVEGRFNPNYKYKFKSYYKDAEPYESDWISSNKTEVSFRANDLGIREVTFVGSNIPFSSDETFKQTGNVGIKEVVIDFFFNRPDGYQNKVERISMTKNGIGKDAEVKFRSYFPLPLTNEYSFRYTFFFEDSTKIIYDTSTGFGPENSDVLLILNPLVEQFYDFKVRKIKDVPYFDYVSVGITYEDQQNQVTKDVYLDYQPDYEDASVVSKKWSFYAPLNKNAATFQLQGTLLESEGSEMAIDLTLQANTSSLFFDTSKEVYSVVVDTSKVDWTKVDSVSVTLLQYEAKSGLNKLSSGALESLAFLRPKELMGFIDEQGKVFNPKTFNFIQPDITDKSPNFIRYYIAYRKRADPNIVFYWKAVYSQKADNPEGKNELYVAETMLTNTFYITLPSNGKSETPTMLEHEHHFTDKKKAGY